MLAAMADAEAVGLRLLSLVQVPVTLQVIQVDETQLNSTNTQHKYMRADTLVRKM